jgi:hypothetical protein
VNGGTEIARGVSSDPMSLRSVRGRLLVLGVLLVGALGGYFAGSRVGPGRILIRGRPLVVARGDKYDASHTIPVVFAPDGAGLRLFVISPDWIPGTVASLDDAGNARVELRFQTGTAFPGNVYFQLWDSKGELRDMVVLDRSEAAVKQIYCYSGLGLQFDPPVEAERIRPETRENVAVISNRSGGKSLEPGQRHVIRVETDASKGSTNTVFIFNPRASGFTGIGGGHLDNEVHLDFDATSPSVGHRFLFLVTDTFGRPMTAFTALGRDLLTLDSIKINEVFREDATRLEVAFEPSIPTERWTLDGGAE